jgi:hypothetical protein
MTSTVYAVGLTVNRSYALLRYDTYDAVPTSDFAKQPAARRVNFTATAATWSYADPEPFLNTDVRAYRLVPATSGAVRASPLLAWLCAAVAMAWLAR